MSKSLSKVTRKAFVLATAKIIKQFLDQQDPDWKRCKFCVERDGKKVVVLPVRPLILGGDDVILLCHTSLAIDFVKEMSKQFSAKCTREAKVWAARNSQKKLWPASGNCMTISAGVLFVKHLSLIHI